MGGWKSKRLGRVLQSHDGYVDVLPALPDAWPAGEFRGMKARGNLTVSAKWENNRVIACRVEGEKGSSFKVKCNGRIFEACESYVFEDNM